MAREATIRSRSAAALVARGKKQRWTGLRKNDAIAGFLLILPNFLGFLIFSVFPILAALFLTFSEWSLAKAPKFVGLRNFFTMSQDWLFWKTLGNTFYYALVAVPIAVVLAFWLAVMINRKVRGIMIFRLVYFVPHITLTVAAAVIWAWIYHPQYGLINYLLSLVGIEGPAWLFDRKWAMPALIIMSNWKGVGYAMLVFLAGLQGIPAELYEAAIVDGANPWHQLRYVTIPMISPAVFFVLTTSFIGAFQGFDQFYIMTKGGPAHATTTLVLYIFNNAFLYFKMGYATSMAAVLFLCILTFTLIQWKGAKMWVYSA